jgi:DNA/RNA endonuclease G (NUC1)
MTNVVPQSLASNQKGWEQLERYCRGLAERGHELHIVCGVSARAVERLTGCAFFQTVPDEVAAALRERVDDVEVRVPRPRRSGD